MFHTNTLRPMCTENEMRLMETIKQSTSVSFSGSGRLLNAVYIYKKMAVWYTYSLFGLWCEDFSSILDFLLSGLRLSSFYRQNNSVTLNRTSVLASWQKWILYCTWESYFSHLRIVLDLVYKKTTEKLFK